MPRHQVKQPLQPFKLKRIALHQPTNKELDLMLLAGCSCLMTLLYHPVAETLRAHSTSTAMQSVPAQTQSERSATGQFYMSPPPTREELKEEEG